MEKLTPKFVLTVAAISIVSILAYDYVKGMINSSSTAKPATTVPPATS